MLTFHALSRPVISWLSLLFFLGLPAQIQAAEGGWKAGTAKTVITPSEPLWMAGYGGRNHPAEGTLHDLWVKALALEDAAGHRAVVFSTDTLGIPQSIYNEVCQRLEDQHNLSRAQVMINASHTHCGPVLRGALYDVYPLDDAQRAAIEKYSDWLEDTIVATASKALANLKPARVHTGQTTCDFAVNRRNNLEPEVPKLREAGELKGPIDHSVPVLYVTDAAGKPLSIVFGYACHNTTLSFYNWCGDYAGFAQMALEKEFPGATAMFFSGCGADQNPLPRRTVELAQGYGTRLATAVASHIQDGQLDAKAPRLQTAFHMADLKRGPVPSRETLERFANGSGYTSRWGQRLLNELDGGHKFAPTYPYPVQAWRIGGDQLWITLGGEVVVDYSLGFKKAFGDSTWVAGYCNDVMAYIPSLRVLEEDVPPRASGRWGYEGNTSMMVYGQPCERWDTSVETTIADTVEQLVQQLKSGK